MKVIGKRKIKPYFELFKALKDGCGVDMDIVIHSDFSVCVVMTCYRPDINKKFGAAIELGTQFDRGPEKNFKMLYQIGRNTLDSSLETLKEHNII